MASYKVTVSKTLVYELDVEATDINDALVKGAQTDLANVVPIENQNVSAYPSPSA